MGEFVEHAIDELVAVLGAEHLGEIDRLIDGNLPWHVRAMLQFIGGEQQDCMFDRIDLRDRAIEMRRDRQRQLGRMLDDTVQRSEEHTSELQSLMRISYAVFCLKKK